MKNTYSMMCWKQEKVKDLECSDVTKPDRETRLWGLMHTMLSHSLLLHRPSQEHGDEEITRKAVSSILLESEGKLL